MSWFNPSENLSEKAERVLKELAENGSSEAACVAECLNDIASNDDDSARD